MQMFFEGMEKATKWAVPLAVFGLGSLGVLAMSDLGLEAWEWFSRRFGEAPERFQEWNEAAQRELDRIQLALNRVAETLEAAQ
jgi:hypothetical protein